MRSILVSTTHQREILELMARGESMSSLALRKGVSVEAICSALTKVRVRNDIDSNHELIEQAGVRGIEVSRTQRHGAKPGPEVLARIAEDLKAKRTNRNRVAREYGVAPSTVWNWLPTADGRPLPAPADECESVGDVYQDRLLRGYRLREREQQKRLRLAAELRQMCHGGV